MASQPWWHTKSLAEMNDDEWEALCDGCAKCCLVMIDRRDDASFSSLVDVVADQWPIENSR